MIDFLAGLAVATFFWLTVNEVLHARGYRLWLLRVKDIRREFLERRAERHASPEAVRLAAWANEDTHKEWARKSERRKRRRLARRTG